MRRRELALGLGIALSTACGGSCSCGGEKDDAATATTPSTTGAAPTAAGSAAAPPRAATSDAGGVDLGDLVRKLEPIEQGKERTAIEAASKGIDWKGVLEGSVEPASMQAALPDAIHGFAADGAAKVGFIESELGQRATTAARAYKHGKASMNIKITDTASAPALRRELEPQLLAVGNVATGNQRGGVVRGVPGIRAYHRESRASRAMAIAQGRFLIEVMVAQTDEQDAAWNAIASLDLKGIKTKR